MSQLYACMNCLEALSLGHLPDYTRGEDYDHTFYCSQSCSDQSDYLSEQSLADNANSTKEYLGDDET